MDSLPPTGPSNAQTSVLVNRSTPLSRDLLSFIFEYLGSVNTLHQASLVCREWELITKMPQFWRGIFSQAGIFIPLNPLRDFHHAHSLFHSVLEGQTGHILRKNMLSCQSPSFEEISLNIDFSKCSHVYFYKDSHVIAHNQKEILVSPLFPPPNTLPKQYTFGEDILSLCTTEGVVYCCLNNGWVVAFSIDHGIGDNLIFSFEALSREEIRSHTFPMSSVNILANDRWLITTTGSLTKQFDRLTGELIYTFVTSYIIRNPQIDNDKFYWTCSLPRDPTRLLYLDLNERTEKIVYRDLPSIISTLHICGNRAFYLAATIPAFFFDSDSVKGNIQYIIKSFDLNSLELDLSYPMSMQEYHKSSHLIIVSNLAIVARRGFDPGNIYNDNRNTTYPGVLECIDLQSGTCLYLTKNYSIHSFSTVFFQNTILFATDDKIVKMTFPLPPHEDVEVISPAPPSLKRLSPKEAQENKEHKKRRMQ